MNSKEKILQAARTLIARDGAKATSMRSIARYADVDVALISHYFGNKEGLFAAVLGAPFSPQPLLETFKKAPLEVLGYRIIETFMDLMDEVDPSAIRIYFNSVLGQIDEAKEVFEMLPVTLLQKRLKDYEDAELRASIVVTQVAGFLIARYVAGLRPISEMNKKDCVTYIGGNLQRILTGELPSSPPDSEGTTAANL